MFPTRATDFPRECQGLRILRGLEGSDDDPLRRSAIQIRYLPGTK